MAASPLSLTSSTPARAPFCLLHHQTSSPFKGNITNLKPNKVPILSIQTHRRSKHCNRALVGVPIKAELASTSSNVSVFGDRFRLNNLGPQPGSRKKAKRKGRGHAAGQGGSCGFGMRGQKSRSGSGVRRGFEGGQMPLYRRVPKLRGIAGGKSSFAPIVLL